MLKSIFFRNTNISTSFRVFKKNVNNSIRLAHSIVNNTPESLKEMITLLQQKFEQQNIYERLKETEAAISDQSDWSQNFATISKEQTQLRQIFQRFEDIKIRTKQNEELLEIAQLESDTKIVDDCIQEIEEVCSEAKSFLVELTMDGEADKNSCYLEIIAGAGGTESCDWVGILRSMYEKWANERQFSVTVAEEMPSEEAGFKSVSLLIDGEYAFGWCRLEAGVHRLVRISPFDAQARRHTSFAQVRVFPLVKESVVGPKGMAIDKNDLKFDYFRAQGAGGQHVNKTESAVRITHIPTGIVCSCQQERSQHKNKEIAMQMLQAKLYHAHLIQRDKEKQNQVANLGDNAWGNQIRSYILQPYQLVKDHRTGKENSNAMAVLNGDIQDFLDAYLVHR